VLDVGTEGDPSIKLCETSAEVARYICLSHCWGDFRPDILTTSMTIETNREAIALDRLPTTYREAVLVTRRLCVRYLWIDSHLWIDSLCIIQDDLGDWAKESATMASVYQNAYLTIAATNAVDDSVGLFHRRSATVHPIPNRPSLYPSRERKIEMKSARKSTYSVYVQNLIRHDWYWDADQGFPKALSPLLNRAWCFQERLLSPRVLHYQLNELSWECLEECACQCSKPVHDGLKARYGQDLSYGSSLRLRDCWHELVRAYSVLLLSFAKDKLPAISGIALQMQELRRTTYLAGLWKDTLLHDLLWTSYRRGPWARVNPWRAPSWSWASVSDEVRYDFSTWSYFQECEFFEKTWKRSKHALKFIIQLHESTCALASQNPTGEVTSGFLRLSGLLCKVILQVEITKNKFEREKLRIFHNKHPLGMFYPDYHMDNNPYSSLFCLQLAWIPEVETKAIRICMILNAIDVDKLTYERVGLLVIPDDDHPPVHVREFLEGCVLKEITIH
jgi:Heterokaryon incompatibility protein (HET)